jgi:hypothetical protein
MATRDKTREKMRYGCLNQPVGGSGILYLRNDNGTGLRNADVISPLMGLDTVNGITRTYSPTDRPHDERFIGSIESCFFKVMPGYTGRKAGDVPGYDAIKNGVVDVQTLYGMLTRYLVDEYPFERNYGIGMCGRRPWDVYQEINKTRGHVGAPDPHTRRMQLGWEVSATPTDEGVRVFEGIWFNSDELQVAREENFFAGPVRVFVDPDNLRIATIIMPGVRDPIEVVIQTTVFSDMTLGEVLQLVAEYRREAPEVTEIYNDQLIQARTRRYDDISAIGVEHDLPRSYSTIEECKKLAKGVFAGARVIRTNRLPGTIDIDAVANIGPGEGVFSLGGDASLIEGIADEVSPKTASEDAKKDLPKEALLAQSDVAIADQASPREAVKTRVPKGQSMKFARPATVRELK